MQIRYEHYECESRHCILWARSCSSNLESNNVVKSVAYIYCLSDWTFEASCFFIAFIVLAYAKPSEDCSFPSVFYGNLRSADSFQSLLELWKIYKVGLDPLSMILGICMGRERRRNWTWVSRLSFWVFWPLMNLVSLFCFIEPVVSVMLLCFCVWSEGA